MVREEEVVFCVAKCPDQHPTLFPSVTPSSTETRSSSAKFRVVREEEVVYCVAKCPDQHPTLFPSVTPSSTETRSSSAKFRVVREEEVVYCVAKCPNQCASSRLPGVTPSDLSRGDHTMTSNNHIINILLYHFSMCFWTSLSGQRLHEGMCIL